MYVFLNTSHIKQLKKTDALEKDMSEIYAFPQLVCKENTSLDGSGKKFY